LGEKKPARKKPGSWGGCRVNAGLARTNKISRAGPESTGGGEKTERALLKIPDNTKKTSGPPSESAGD